MSLTLTVGGVDVTGCLLAKTFKVTDQLNARGLCSFTLRTTNLAGYELGTETDVPVVTETGLEIATRYSPQPLLGVTPDEGQAVVATDGATTIFGGTIEQVIEYKLDGPGLEIRYEITCVDYSQLADRFLVAATYEDDGQTCGSIMKEVVATFMSGEGIDVSAVQDGPEVTKALWNYEYANTVFDDLASLAGFAWWIDHDKVLHFADRSTYAAPFALSDSGDNFRKLRITKTRQQYRNRQYVRAGVDFTDPITDASKGNGQDRAFLGTFPIAQVPSSVTVNDVAKTVGIRGVDTGKDFYWQKGDASITQDSSGTLLTSSDVVSWTYIGQYPLVTSSQDNGEIAARAAIEGGSGVYEAILDAPDVDGRDMALDKGQAQLMRFGHIPRQVDYETDTPGLASGQLQDINITVHDLSGSWLIDKVTVTDFNGQALRYTAHALDGQSLGGWHTFFAQLAASGRKYTVRDNEVLTLQRLLSDAVTCGETVSYTTAGPESRADFALAGYSEAA